MQTILSIFALVLSVEVPLAELEGQVARIFDLVEGKTTTAASRAATRQKLTKVAPKDNDDYRAKYAYALALIHEHLYAEALACTTRLIKSEPKYLAARKTRAWLLLTLQKNTEALAELESLAKLLPLEESTDHEEFMYLDAAQFLGTVIGYFEGPGKTLIKEPVCTKYKTRFLECLTSKRRAAFYEQSKSVAERYAELREENEQASAKVVQKHKQAAEAVHTKQAELAKGRTEVSDQAEKTVQQLRDEWKRLGDEWTAAQNTYTQLSAQTVLLQNQRAQAQNALQLLQNPMKDAKGNIPATARDAYNRYSPRVVNTINTLENELAAANVNMMQLVQRGVLLETRMAALAAEGERAGESFVLNDQLFGKQAKLLAAQEKRVGKTLERTREKKPASNRYRDFHHYDDFSYDAEKHRLLESIASQSEPR